MVWRADDAGRVLARFLAMRTPRERGLLLAVTVLALIWIGYAAVLQPLVRHNAALAEGIARRAIVLNQIARLPPADPDGEVAGDRRPVAAILAETAQTMGLVIRRLEPEGRGTRLVLEEASFETVILWLDLLDADHALRVSQLDLTRRPAPGMVAAALLLER